MLSFRCDGWIDVKSLFDSINSHISKYTLKYASASIRLKSANIYSICVRKRVCVILLKWDRVNLMEWCMCVWYSCVCIWWWMESVMKMNEKKARWYQTRTDWSWCVCVWNETKCYKNKAFYEERERKLTWCYWINLEMIMFLCANMSHAWTCI